jgi:hypothetical protein
MPLVIKLTRDIWTRTRNSKITFSEFREIPSPNFTDYLFCLYRVITENKELKESMGKTESR